MIVAVFRFLLYSILVASATLTLWFLLSLVIEVVREARRQRRRPPPTHE